MGESVNEMNMEIVCMEKKRLEMMVGWLKGVGEKVGGVRGRREGGGMERWVRGEEVWGELRMRGGRLESLGERGVMG